MIKRVQSELFTFLLAVQFLTRVPLPTDAAFSPSRQAASVRHYPLVGVSVGGFAALVFFASLQLFPATIAVLLSTAATLLLTGAFHEDGLADTFDGIGGGLTKERSLEIMRDSRIGAYGSLALLIALPLKLVSLSLLVPVATIVCLISRSGRSHRAHSDCAV